jgi:hypothetical protein
MIGKRNIEVLVSSPEDMETARANSKIKVCTATYNYKHALLMLRYKSMLALQTVAISGSRL